MIVIRDMTPDDEYFVSTCSHINENEEMDTAGRRRQVYLRGLQKKGLSVKVALIDGVQVGFIYVLPIEQMPWGFTGRELHCFPCIWIKQDAWKQGAGSALLKSAEDEVRGAGRKGLATLGYYWDFWFMQASWFENRGYECIDRRGDEGILVRKFSDEVEPPHFLEPDYKFRPISGKVVVDLFYMTYCLTSDVEAARVREVAAEFGGRIVLNEYCSDDPEILQKYQISRAIYINGKEVGWGYEAPKEGIREAINNALKAESL